MGIVYALDLATVMGFAYGEPSTVPVSGAVRLKKPSEPRATAFSNLVAFLNTQFQNIRPVLVIVEAPLHIGAFAKLGGMDVVRMTYGFHAIAAALAARHGIPFEEIGVATARKHFLSRAHFNDRRSTKLATVQRCQQLGYMKKDETSDNQADALCVWDWACAHLMRVAPKELHLFGGKGPPEVVEW